MSFQNIMKKNKIWKLLYYFTNIDFLEFCRTLQLLPFVEKVENPKTAVVFSREKFLLLKNNKYILKTFRKFT